MADNTAKSLNGELRVGDLVIAAGKDEYAYLVGRVLAIDKVGSAGRVTENITDDVHVNFMEVDYSDHRIKEIETMLSDLYDEPKSLYAAPLDDTIMAPDMLFRITDVEPEKLAMILESEDNAANFVKGMGEDVREEKLFNRLAENFTTFKKEIMGLDKEAIFANAEEIVSVTQAYQYFHDEHPFTEEQADYLLRFENPLQVVSDRWGNTMHDISHVVRAIFDKQNQESALSCYVLDDPVIGHESVNTLGDEKASVLAQIRHARKEARENPVPNKDAGGKNREPER